MTRLPIIVLLILILCKTNSQTKVTIASGNWNNANIWSPAGVPGAANDVTISAGHVINITTNEVCRNLTVGTSGALATLRFSGVLPRTFTVSGNLTVNTQGEFGVQNSSLATHNLILNGNVVNNGTFDVRRNALSLANISITGTGIHTFSGNGTTEFANITLNMGASAANVFELSAPNVTTQDNFLTLINGTFRLSAPGLALVPFTVNTSIPSTAGLQVNATGARLTLEANLTLAGSLGVTNGMIQVGDAPSENLTCNSCGIALSGGSLNVAGYFSATAGAPSISITGGVMTVPSISSANTTIAPFNLTAAGGTFNWSSGIIVIPREGGTGAQDLGFVRTGSTAGTINGGTLQIGNAATTSGQVMSINSSGSLPSLMVNSANATCMLVTNPLRLAGSLNIVSGAFRTSNLAVTLGGNWSNTGTYAGGSSLVTFSAATSQSIFATSGETFASLTISGSGVKTLLSPVRCTSGFTVATGSSFDVGAASNSFSVAGSFVASGTWNGRSGNVTLNGAAQQTVSGTGTIQFHDLTINNLAGVRLQVASQLRNTLFLNNGNFNVTGQNFTLLSDASGTARVASISASADLTGNVIIQRYIPGPYTGWALIGSPLSNALTFSALDDDMFITCQSCPDGYSNFTSVYTYNEAAPGAFDDQGGYVAVNSISTAFSQGKGYWIYTGTGLTLTNPITIDVTGTIRKSAYSIPLLYTNHGTPQDDGWNLVHNPYPSPVSWAAILAASPGVENAVYIYNTDMRGGSGGYVTYINGQSSPAVGSGGIGNEIPMFQGFYVHSTGGTALNFQESMKIAGSQPILKERQRTLVRVNLSGEHVNDEVLVYQDGDATDNFDPRADALKRLKGIPVAKIALPSREGLLQVNGVANLDDYTTGLHVSGKQGQYSIKCSELKGLPANACVSLYDKTTGTTTDLRKTDYTFTMNDSDAAGRFTLSVLTGKGRITTTTTEPSCDGRYGMIVAQAGSGRQENFEWRKDGAIIKDAEGRGDTLFITGGGKYFVSIPGNGCYEPAEAVLVNTHGNCGTGGTHKKADPAEDLTAYRQSENSIIVKGSCLGNPGLLQLLDNAGRIALTLAVDPTEQVTVPIALPAGIYTVRFVTAASASSRKIAIY